MTRYAAFLRGVNLGKRTVKSADLRVAFEAMGFANVKTLLASGNVLFDARASKGLKEKIETGLLEQFGFAVPTVLRAVEELKAIVADDPFAGLVEDDNRKLYTMLFADELPEGFALAGVENDYDIPGIGPREVFMVAHRKPDGTYSGGLLTIEKQLPRGVLVTTRNWNTILKAIA